MSDNVLSSLDIKKLSDLLHPQGRRMEVEYLVANYGLISNFLGYYLPENQHKFPGASAAIAENLAMVALVALSEVARVKVSMGENPDIDVEEMVAKYVDTELAAILEDSRDVLRTALESLDFTDPDNVN